MVENARLRRIELMVQEWARENAPDDLHYGTPYSYYVKAKEAGLFTQDDFEQLARWYGERWHHRGD
jgi:hypothetical protein